MESRSRTKSSQRKTYSICQLGHSSTRIVHHTLSECPTLDPLLCSAYYQYAWILTFWRRCPENDKSVKILFFLRICRWVQSTSSSRTHLCRFPSSSINRSASLLTTRQTRFILILQKSQKRRQIHDARGRIMRSEGKLYSSSNYQITKITGRHFRRSRRDNFSFTNSLRRNFKCDWRIGSWRFYFLWSRSFGFAQSSTRPWCFKIVGMAFSETSAVRRL